MAQSVIRFRVEFTIEGLKIAEYKKLVQDMANLRNRTVTKYGHLQLQQRDVGKKRQTMHLLQGNRFSTI